MKQSVGCRPSAFLMEQNLKLGKRNEGERSVLVPTAAKEIGLIGEDIVVQVVTDNASAYKKAGEMLMEKRKGLY
ncbi:hypothetical protein QVD17_24415 [Tagetes erecta]|uniref:DUF659 domain-containing protein n=1 Tax=Tagetes erecta TaxID=13708 RepID=A0AAD8NMR9_TARER|nr:hypothetical protein QVD17_24415 [Tagetes erecta]